MPGPIGFGVFKALDEQRRNQRRPTPSTPGEGWLFFVLSTIMLSWLAAIILVDTNPADGQPLSIRLLWGSLYYAATMGWQPLVAAWLARRFRSRRLATNRGMRWPPLREIGLATVIPIGLASLAMVVAHLIGEAPQRAEAFAGPALAAVAALIVLCIQSLGEEYGWRGAPMSYAIERWGTRPALVIHGIAWGCWYAPMFVLSAPTPAASLGPAGGFMITCMLLGIVFGWLRLRSGSILPPTIANAVLTMVAGLPLLLREGSIGIRDAVFRWPGWPIIGIVAIVILLRRPRDLETN